MDLTLIILLVLGGCSIVLLISGVIRKSSAGSFEILKDPYIDYVTYRWIIAENFNGSWLRLEMYLQGELNVIGVNLVAQATTYGRWNKRGHQGITLMGSSNKVRITGGSTNCSSGKEKTVVSSAPLNTKEAFDLLKNGFREICLHNTEGDIIIQANAENAKKVFLDLMKAIEENKFQNVMTFKVENKIQSPNQEKDTINQFNELYNNVTVYIKKLNEISASLIVDGRFYQFFCKQNGESRLTQKEFEKYIAEVFEIDFLSVLNKLNSIQTNSTPESLTAQYYIFINSTLRRTKKAHSSFDVLNDKEVQSYVISRINALSNDIPKLNETDEISFKLEELIKNYDPGIFIEYIQLLYRIAVVVSKYDNFLSEKELSFVKLLKVSIKNKNVLLNSSSLKTASLESSNIKLEEALISLNNLIGLDSVKKEIISLINFIELQNKRKKNSLKTPDISYHLVFTGNPGTGKTTVARILANIFKELGIVSKGHLIETDRSGLIAEYVGQTAVKVNKIVDSALDGVLFIDEAYALSSSKGHDFAEEAVSTLIKRIEDDRKRLIVILAGYTKEMEDFIDTNPGIKSRFNRFIEFQDYTSFELLSIFKKYCADQEYQLEELAEAYLLRMFDIKLTEAKGDNSFGNGRYVRNLFEKSIQNQANRLSEFENIPTWQLSLIIEEDIKALS